MKVYMTIRKKHWNLRGAGLAACFSFCMQFGFGQQLQTITGKKDILIGEQIKLRIKASLPLNAAGLNKWLIIPDSIPHFDIVETGKIDTVNTKDDYKTLEQTITFTSFDSGRWVFPALPVEFSGATGQSVKIEKTDSFFVNVSYSPPDSTNQLRDITNNYGFYHRLFLVLYYWRRYPVVGDCFYFVQVF